MGEVIAAPTDLFTHPALAPEVQQQVKVAFDALPADKRLAVLVLADLDGTAHAMVTTRFGEHWKATAGATYKLGDKRPAGYVGIEGSF